MEDDRLTVLEQRIAKIERSDRNQQSIVIALACAVAGLIILNQQSFTDEQLKKSAETFISSAMVAATGLLIVNRQVN